MKIIGSSSLVLFAVVLTFVGCSRQVDLPTQQTNGQAGQAGQASANNASAVNSAPAVVDFPICSPDVESRVMITTGLTAPETAKVDKVFNIEVLATNVGGCFANKVVVGVQLSGVENRSLTPIVFNNMDKGDQRRRTEPLTISKTGDLKIVANSFVELNDGSTPNHDPERRQERKVKIVP